MTIVSCDGVTRVPYSSNLPPQSFSKTDMLSFFFKNSLNIYKIRNGKSKISLRREVMPPVVVSRLS